MRAPFTNGDDMILRQTQRFLAAIGTSVFICCFDRLPLFMRKGVDCDAQARAAFEVLPIVKKGHPALIVRLPAAGGGPTAFFVTSVPIAVHGQLVFRIGSVPFARLRQSSLTVLGIMLQLVLATLLSCPFSIFRSIEQSLIARRAITACSVAFLFGTSRAW